MLDIYQKSMGFSL